MSVELAPRAGLIGRRTVDRYDLPVDLTFDEWRGIVGTLTTIDRAVKWWLGDALVFGERMFGQEHSAILPTPEEDPHGISQSVLKQAAWMSATYPPSTRVPTLSWTHHRVAAELDPKDRAEVLGEALSERLSTRELLTRVKERQEQARAIEAHAEPAPSCAAESVWKPTPDDLTEEAAARMRFERTMAGRAATFEMGWTLALAWADQLDAFERSE